MICESKQSTLFRETTLPILLSILEGLDTPRSLMVFKLLSAAAIDKDSGALEQIKQLKLLPSQYIETDITKFRLDFQAFSLLSKLPNVFDLPLKQEALKAFGDAEDQCFRINRSFLTGERDLLFSRLETDITFDDIKRKLNYILGKPPLLIELGDLGGWGPGSSFALNREYASPEMKCEYESTITYKLAKALGPHIYFCCPWLVGKPLQLVPGNLVTTVPKNLKTDRTIAIEPALNSFFQKGLGTKIRRRLKKHGIDLNDQRFNQEVPERCIVDGMCTLDLKAASDSISLEFVRRVLPYGWLELVELTRSERGSFDSRKTAKKTWFEYEKVSSMGNGFTFELESALFYCVLLALGIPKELIYVYGDDLCFPASEYDRVVRALRGCGFTENDEKSFRNGLFYESCGVYTFNGAFCNPLKVKEVLSGPKDFIVLANKIRLFSNLLCDSDGCYRGLLAAWRMCVSGLPDYIRRSCRGPIGSGQLIFCDPNEAVDLSYSKRRGALRTAQLVQKSVTRLGDFASLMHYRLRQQVTIPSSSLYDCPDISLGNQILTKTIDKWVCKPLFIEQWNPSFGRWRELAS